LSESSDRVDGLSASSQVLVTVTVLDVNDNRPTFNQSTYRGSVCEMTTGSLVNMDTSPITVTDQDQVDPHSVSVDMLVCCQCR